MTFDYLRTIQSLDSINIEDIGNTCINAINDDAEEWYLSISTENGWSVITEFGPVTVDSNKLKNYFMYSKFSMEFNERKIYTLIDKFINNSKRAITQVFELEKLKAKERFISIKNVL